MPRATFPTRKSDQWTRIREAIYTHADSPQDENNVTSTLMEQLRRVGLYDALNLDQLTDFEEFLTMFARAIVSKPERP